MPHATRGGSLLLLLLLHNFTLSTTSYTAVPRPLAQQCSLCIRVSVCVCVCVLAFSMHCIHFHGFSLLPSFFSPISFLQLLPFA